MKGYKVIVEASDVIYSLYEIACKSRNMSDINAILDVLFSIDCVFLEYSTAFKDW